MLENQQRNEIHFYFGVNWNPWGTVQLRCRLVQDFGQIPTDANTVDRASVMSQLLQCYQQEGLALSDGTANRTRVYLDGTPVSSTVITQLLTQLRLWTKQTMPNGTNN